MGSSPRVRGTLRGRRAWRPRAGIIPACAGNTLLAYGLISNLEDHPRVCGEHSAYRLISQVATGSSPRVRGTPDEVVAAVGELGIIPACAGNTSICWAFLENSGDHPRVCGEHVLASKSR